MKILILESSTTSAKVLLFDTETGLSDLAVTPLRALAESETLQDGEQVFDQLCATARQLLSEKRITSVDVIALSGTWHSVMLADENFRPLTPVYQWNDTSASEISSEFRRSAAYVKNYYQTTGCMVNAIYPFFKLKFLGKQGHDLTKMRIFGQGSYHTFRLTGEYVTTRCMASGSGLMNIHNCEYEKSLLAACGITERNLPCLIDSSERFPLSSEGADLLGLSKGIPVIPANSDGGLNQLGDDATQPGHMTFSVGTSGALRLTAEKPLLSENQSTWCYLSPQGWLSGAATSGCCNCVDWYKNSLQACEISYAELESDPIRFDAPPIFLPFIFGERCPGWMDQRLGGFYRIRPQHDAIDLHQSVLMGTLFNLYDCYLELKKLHGRPQLIKLSGGILNSSLWLQMCADIFNEEMTLSVMKHSSVFGAVKLAGSILSIPLNLPQKEHRIISPNPDHHEKYSLIFEQYKQLYQETSI